MEINKEDLRKQAVSCEQIRADIEEFVMPDGRKLYLIADGRLVNLAGERGQGHPAEIMDMSFAMQALSAKYLTENKVEVGVHKTPDETDRYVAELKLNAMNIEIDELTSKQVNYMNNWEEGT